MQGCFTKLYITIQLHRAVGLSEKSFITEEVLYKDLRIGFSRFS